jgi:hypothetical protein
MNSVKLKTAIEKEITRFSNDCCEYATDMVYIANNRRNIGLEREVIQTVLKLFQDSFNQAVMAKMDSFLLKLDPILKQVDDAEEVSIQKPSFSRASTRNEAEPVAVPPRHNLTMNLG